VREKRGEPLPTEEPTPIAVYGDGEVLLTFEVRVPEWTPKEDKIYIRIDGFFYGKHGGVPMEEKAPHIWTVAFMAPANQALRYKYNRNNFGFATDEEFSPDSEDARREIHVGTEPRLIQDEVKKWRWLSEEPPKANISSFRPDRLPERAEPFIIGVSLLDYYQDTFDDFVASTLDRIKEKGFNYVGISYTPSYFTSSEPLTFSHEPINTWSEEQLDLVFSEARKRGLKIMLAAGIETDPRNFDEIEAGLRTRHSDDWYIQLVHEWKASMVRTAETAEKHGVEILVISNQWPFWGDPTDDQKRMLNSLVNDAIQSVRNAYSGKISSDYYAEDEFFDYYKQLDWVGDKWWWALTDKKEASIEEMKIRAENIIDERYEPIYEKYHKPIFLQQLAYSAYDGAAGASQIGTEGPEVAEWFPYNPDWPADFQEQADAYEAVFQAIYDEPIFAGAFAFSYSYWDSYDKSAGIRSKPSEDVWIKWNSIFLEK